MTRTSDVSTYDDDFFAWTQEQAAALRRLPQEMVGDTVDIAHVAEEIEDLGKRDLREVSSYLARLFEHLMKITSFPHSTDVAHWKAEALLFKDGATDAYSPSMGRALDVPGTWKKARRRQTTYSRQLNTALRAPIECPFLLQDLLAEDFDLNAALTKVGAVRDDSAA